MLACSSHTRWATRWTIYNMDSDGGCSKQQWSL